MHIYSRLSLPRSEPREDSDRGEGIRDRHLQAEDETSQSPASTVEDLSDLQQTVKCRDIIIAASRISEVSTADILSARRMKHITLVRHIVYKLTYELCPYSFPQMGRMLNRDHTTIISGIKGIDIKIMHNKYIRDLYDKILAEVLG
jgi:chromosomal replication initiation ATPase DnaA